MKEPSDESLLAARLAWHRDEIPGIGSPYTCAKRAQELCAIRSAQMRHAERWCSDEWYQSKAEAVRERLMVRAAEWCVMVPGAVVELHGDPRGAVLTLKLPGMTEAVAV